MASDRTPSAASIDYEYGVWGARQQPGEEPHRAGMTREQARQWVKEWNEMDGELGTFIIVKRPLGDWIAAVEQNV